MESLTQTHTPSREKVMATALRLFARNGYFNTSLRDITRASNVSTGAVYHAFKDKEAIAAALQESLLAQMQSDLERIVDENHSAHDQCRAVVKLLFELTDRQPETMSFMLYVRHREFLPSARPICSSRPFVLMREMVERGMERGEIAREDPMIAAACLFGGPIRMITLSLDGVISQPLASQLDAVWACAWRSVAAA